MMANSSARLLDDCQWNALYTEVSLLAPPMCSRQGFNSTFPSVLNKEDPDEAGDRSSNPRSTPELSLFCIFPTLKWSNCKIFSYFTGSSRL
jgi:hypothetical protein